MPDMTTRISCDGLQEALTRASMTTCQGASHVGRIPATTGGGMRLCADVLRYALSDATSFALHRQRGRGRRTSSGLQDFAGSASARAWPRYRSSELRIFGLGSTQS